MTTGKSFKNRVDQETLLRPRREVIERSRLRKYVDLSGQQQFKVMDIEGRPPARNSGLESDVSHRKKRHNDRNINVRDEIDESIALVKRSPKMTRDLGYLKLEDEGDEKIKEQTKKGYRKYRTFFD
uniref:Uncharacterized protein n=1 Tax=Romanomermis culicivorax TaxID=13658 RepID=A0A915KRK4_ROMCU